MKPRQFERPSSAGYSPNTAIDLLVGDLVLPAAEVGGGRIKLRDPISFDASAGIIRLQIGDEEILTRVRLPDKLTATSSYQRIEIVRSPSSTTASV
ncbi:MAG TPA: hypothetical protein VGN72_11240 [Tepidisphaeraceae bacterium]|jgi:hypothetical protein|nr:hypothetical protein [Tepidisphaeraceae bacterium]